MKSKKEIIKRLEEYSLAQEGEGQSNWPGYCYHVVEDFRKSWGETLGKQKKIAGNKLETGLYYKNSKENYVHVPNESEGIDIFDYIDSWGYEAGVIDALLWVIKEKPRFRFIPNASSKYEQTFREKPDTEGTWN